MLKIRDEIDGVPILYDKYCYKNFYINVELEEVANEE